MLFRTSVQNVRSLDTIALKWQRCHTIIM